MNRQTTLQLPQTAQQGLNANQLKLIEVVAMVIDHCTIVFVPDDFWAVWILRMIGRMTAPIMCYFVAQGYYHTRSLPRYMGRLPLVGLAAHIPHNLCFGYSLWRFWQATDVMFALLFGLVALAVWKSERFALWQKALAVCGCCMLAYSSDWNYIAVLWVLGMGVFYQDKQGQLRAFLLVAAVYLLQPFIYGTTLHYASRFGVFFAFLLLCRYNGQRGSKSRLVQWGFYWFYPLHLLLLWWLGSVL